MKKKLLSVPVKRFIKAYIQALHDRQFYINVGRIEYQVASLLDMYESSVRDAIEHYIVSVCADLCIIPEDFGDHHFA